MYFGQHFPFTVPSSYQEWSQMFFLLEHSTTSSSSLSNVIFENADNHLGNEAHTA